MNLRARQAHPEARGTWVALLSHFTTHLRLPRHRHTEHSNDLYSKYDVQNFTFGSVSQESSGQQEVASPPVFTPRSLRQRHPPTPFSNPSSVYSSTEDSSSDSGSVESLFVSDHHITTPRTSLPSTDEDIEVDGSEDSDDLFQQFYDDDDDNDDIEIHIGSTIYEGSVYDGGERTGSPIIHEARRTSEATILRAEGASLSDRRGSAATVTRLTNSTGGSGSGSGSGGGSRTLQGTSRSSPRPLSSLSYQSQSLAGAPLSSVGTSDYYDEISHGAGPVPSQADSIAFDQTWEMMKGGQVDIDPSQFLNAPSSSRKEDGKGSSFIPKFFRKDKGGKKKAEASEIDTFERAVKEDWTMNPEYYEQWVWTVVAADPSVKGEKEQKLLKASSSSTAINVANNSSRTGEVIQDEMWSNALVGQFHTSLKLTRKYSRIPSCMLAYVKTASSQKLLKARPVRSAQPDRPNLPSIIVHCHSTASAWSITRFHKLKGKPPPARSTGVVLLTSLKNQQRYTTTGTTKKLGEWRETQHKETETVTLSSSTSTTLHDPSVGEPAPSPTVTITSMASDAPEGSKTPTTSLPSLTSNKANPHKTDIPPSIPFSDTLYTHRIVPEASGSGSHSVNEQNQYGDEESDEDDKELGLPSRRRRRTPHSKAFDTVDPSEIDQIRDSHRHSVSLPRVNIKSETVTESKGKPRWKSDPDSAESVPSRRGSLITPYTPPWVIFQPRHTLEQKKRMVSQMNSSFEGVGLLPASGEGPRSRDVKGKGRAPREQRENAFSKRPHQSLTAVSWFDQVPEDVFFMLLPLWVGETDGPSKFKHPYEMESTPVTERHFLMVYYRPYARNRKREMTNSKGDTSSSSFERVSKRSTRTDAVTYDILVRILTYEQLQGSNIRIPDKGMTVSGPLQDAYEQRPRPTQQDTLKDWRLGIYTSKAQGIAFDPECLLKLELGRKESSPDRLMPFSRDGTEYSDEPLVQMNLTPIGQAVVEWAWIGLLCLISSWPHAKRRKDKAG
jgi:hypothetical protein